MHKTLLVNRSGTTLEFQSSVFKIASCATVLKEIARCLSLKNRSSPEVMAERAALQNCWF